MRRFLLIFSFFVLLPFVLFAAPPSGGWAPGVQLEPDCAPGSSSDCTVRQAWEINTADGIVYNMADKVGIGTDSPSATLSVNGSVSLYQEISGALMTFLQGDLSLAGGDRGYFFYAGNGSTITGLSLLDYNGGNPIYSLNVDNGTTGAQVDMDSLTGGFTARTSNPGGVTTRHLQGDISGLGYSLGIADGVQNNDSSIFGTGVFDYNSGNPIYHLGVDNGMNSTSLNLSSLTGAFDVDAVTFSFNADQDISISTDDFMINGVDFSVENNVGSNVANIYANATTANANLFAGDANSDGSVFVGAGSAGIIYNTVSTENDGNGTPLVMSVFDENERGAGYSARSRNLTYAQAGIDLFVWDPDFGGDRTFIYITESGIRSEVRFDANNLDYKNSTFNDESGMLFIYHSGDPDGIGDQRVYGISNDFTWTAGSNQLMMLQGSTGFLSLRQDGAAPSYRLDVQGDNASTYVARLLNDGNNDNRLGLLIQTGADTPNAGKWIQFNDGDGTDVGSICYTGGQADVCAPSDERLKTNISETELSLDVLDQIKVRDFAYLSNPGRTVHGFVAQELNEVYPDAVMVPENSTEYWKVSYSQLAPLVVKSIQDLHLDLVAIDNATSLSFRSALASWFAEPANGIHTVVADVITGSELHATDKICIGETCVTERDLIEILQAKNSALETNGSILPEQHEAVTETQGGDGNGDEIEDEEDVVNTAPLAGEDEVSSSAEESAL